VALDTKGKVDAARVAKETKEHVFVS